MTDSVLTLQPVDSLTITVLVDNSFDGLLAGTEHVQRMGLASAPRVPGPMFENGVAFGSLFAEHGFSALVDITVGDRNRRLLFDAGVSPDGLIGNLDRMGIDPASIEVIVLSHGHFDHLGGMNGLATRLGSVNVPVFIHPLLFTRRRIQFPGGGEFEMPLASRSALEGAGFELTDDRQPRFLLDDAILITGEIDRTGSFEPGMPPPHQALVDGRWESDPLVLDDQALVVNVRGEGLVVMSGCGHAGIINTTKFVQRLTGTTSLLGVIGGFHLSGPFYEPVVPKVVDAFAALSPRVLMPGHCTGWKAISALGQALPDAVHPSSVGSRLVF